MKKTIAALAAASMLIPAIPAMAASDDITVTVNGSAIDFSAYDNVLPYIENGFTLIPIRAIAEAMGLTVAWDGDAQTVTLTNDETEIVLTIGTDRTTINGTETTCIIAARIKDDRTFIPLRFVSESMGAAVDWNGDTRTITITEEETSALALIDNSKWQLNVDDNVYWQTGISYCASPADSSYETLGVFVPAGYFDSEDNGDGTFTCSVNTETIVNGYTALTAPMVIPVNTPGYSAMAAPTEYSSSVKSYTDAGFVYIYAGARGRDHGAPAGVTDFKAAIRYIRSNGSALPGDKDSIFSFGMSGGGAQSAILGATGNSAMYESYLNAIGAANESDAVKGSMCWCPITGLDIANEAYEWNLGTARSGLDEETQRLSDGLANAFASYINEIKLKDENGTELVLEQDENGKWTKGTYYDYVKSEIERSLNNFLSDTTFPYTKEASKSFGGGMGGGMPQGNNANAPIEALDGIQRNAASGTDTEAKTYETAEEYIAELNGDEPWITYDAATNKASISSVEAFVKACKSPSKSVGAFDDLNASQGENILFGYGDGKGAHFDAIMAKLLENTEYAEAYNTDIARVDTLGKIVSSRVDMYTPMYFLDDMHDGYKTADVAKYFRIRTGINQGDTALSTEIDLALGLKAYGSEVDFEMVWGQGHTKAERGAQDEGAADTNFINWVNDCMAK